MFVFVGLGSNMGDRAAHLRAGIAGFARCSGGDGVWQSPVYESAPLYVTEQPPFLNMVIGGRCTEELGALLAHLKELEAEAGRDLSTHALRNGPRPLDMDILLSYENDDPRDDPTPLIIETPELIIPHPKMAERAFVLFPLRDLAPDLVHPTVHRTIAELAGTVVDQDARNIGPLAESDKGRLP